MAETFDVGAAATNAFRPRSKRGVLLGATFAYLLVMLALAALYLWINLPAFKELSGWYFHFFGSVLHASTNGDRPDLSSFMPPAELYTLAPSAAAYGLLSWIARSAYEAACLRWLVRGETGGVLGLSLGGDTWLVFFTYLMWLVVLLVLIICGACAIAAIFAAVHAVGAIEGATWAVVLLSILAPFVCLGVVGGIIYAAVRLAPAAAASVGARRFAFFEAWRATKGRFWPMLGAFLLVFVAYVIAEAVIRAIFFWPISMGVMQIALSSETPSLDRFIAGISSPQILALIGAGGLFYTLASAIVALAAFGINARAIEASEVPASA